MLVYGKNVAREVLNSDLQIKEIYLLDTFSSQELINLIKKHKITPKIKTQSEMGKMTKEPHQGIIIEIEDYKFLDFEKIKKDDLANFIVVLDRIEDPRNFGAIIRTCECAGVDYIIIPNKGNSEITSSVVKTSSGAIANVKIVQVSNLRNTLDYLKKLEYWVIGTDADGKNYKEINYKGKVALVIGSEGFGLKHIIRESCDEVASIPIKGKVNSLNASVAAGIMIYEIASWR